MADGNGVRAVRVVVPHADGGIPCKAQGTQLLLPDGTPVPGVTGITLRASVDGVWRATVEMLVEPPRELQACLARVVVKEAPVVDGERDVSDLRSESRQFVRA